jgi:hypothetical protein
VWLTDILETNRPFLSPSLSVGNSLHRVPSAQTLVGSVSDDSRIQYGAHVNQWVQNTWDLNRDYSDESVRVELPGSFNFGEQLLPATTSGTLEEHNDDIGSFFRAWREGQTERKQHSAELDQ